MPTQVISSELHLSWPGINLNRKNILDLSYGLSYILEFVWPVFVWSVKQGPIANRGMVHNGILGKRPHASDWWGLKVHCGNTDLHKNSSGTLWKPYR